MDELRLRLLPAEDDIQPRMELQQASWLSQLLFSWVSPLISAGYQHPLEQNDLFELPSGVQPCYCIAKLGQEWQQVGNIPGCQVTITSQGVVCISEVHPSPSGCTVRRVTYVALITLLGSKSFVKRAIIFCVDMNAACCTARQAYNLASSFAVAKLLLNHPTTTAVKINESLKCWEMGETMNTGCVLVT